MLSCVAFAQRRSRRSYIKALGWDVQSSGRTDRSARAEIRPGDPAWLLSQSPEQQARIAEIRWGYRSAARSAAPALQARIEKAVNGRYAALWRHGRALLPADGWYSEPDAMSGQSPGLVRSADGAPMFIAAITNFWIAGELPEAGFLVVSGECGEGVAGERDCEPLVLAPEDAQLWLDPKLSAEQAQRLAAALACGREAFRLDLDRGPISEADGNAYRMPQAGVSLKP
jgi:putative SOS response-associated peptidase YedK